MFQYRGFSLLVIVIIPLFISCKKDQFGDCENGAPVLEEATLATTINNIWEGQTVPWDVREIRVNYTGFEGAENTFAWFVPEDAEILQGQGTSRIFVKFNKKAGDICCEVSNKCGTSNRVCKSIDTDTTYVTVRGNDYPGLGTYDLKAIAVDNDIFVGFGNPEGAPGLTEFTPHASDWYRYDPFTDQYTTLTSPPNDSLNGAIIGASKTDIYFSHPSHFWKYNIPSDSWTRLNWSLDGNTYDPAAWGNMLPTFYYLLDDELFAFGKNSFDVVKIYKYNTVADNWEDTNTSLPTDIPTGQGVFRLGDRLIFPKWPTPSLVYELGHQMWTEMAPIRAHVLFTLRPHEHYMIDYDDGQVKRFYPFGDPVEGPALINHDGNNIFVTGLFSNPETDTYVTVEGRLISFHGTYDGVFGGGLRKDVSQFIIEFE